MPISGHTKSSLLRETRPTANKSQFLKYSPHRMTARHILPSQSPQLFTISIRPASSPQGFADMSRINSPIWRLASSYVVIDEDICVWIYPYLPFQTFWCAVNHSDARGLFCESRSQQLGLGVPAFGFLQQWNNPRFGFWRNLNKWNRWQRHNPSVSWGSETDSGASGPSFPMSLWRLRLDFWNSETVCDLAFRENSSLWNRWRFQQITLHSRKTWAKKLFQDKVKQYGASIRECKSWPGDELGLSVSRNNETVWLRVYCRYQVEATGFEFLKQWNSPELT